MPTTQDISRIVSDLHKNKILNADASIREVLASSVSGIANPGEKVGWYVLGGEHYVIVCGFQAPGEVAELGSRAASMKSAFGE